MMTGYVMGDRSSCVRLPAVAREISSKFRDVLTLGGWSMKPIALEFCNSDVEKARSGTSTFLFDLIELCLIKHKDYLQYITNKCTIYLMLEFFLNCSVLSKTY
jgi:hypothetical protein